MDEIAQTQPQIQHIPNENIPQPLIPDRGSQKRILFIVIAGVLLLLASSAFAWKLVASMSQEANKPSPTPTVLPASPSPIPTSAPSATPTIVSKVSIPTAIPKKIPTPTPTPSFPAITDVNKLFGQVSITCDSVSGFAFDPRNPETGLRFHANFKSLEHTNNWLDGSSGYVGIVDQASPDIDSFYNISGNHRFSYALDNDYRVGKPVEFHVYAGRGIDEDGRIELPGSPATITCFPK